jgi:DNA helicase-2/ATP-dependent DNA helicase PcrA
VALTSSQQERLQEQIELLDAARRMGPVGAVPYFGHLRVQTPGRVLDLLLAARTQPGPEVSFIDWRSAPQAEAFFGQEEGDEYELELEHRFLTGKVLRKNFVVFDQGQLIRVECASETLERMANGEWTSRPTKRVLLPPRPPEERTPFRSPLEVTLDADQQKVVDLPAQTSVLLLGEAGFGKTTVALRRLVALRDRSERKFRGAVMVPTEGLARLTKLMLERRGIEDVDVWTYDQWAWMVTRRAFKDFPRRQSVNTPARIMALKRHPALEGAIAQLAKDRPHPTKDDDRPSRSSTWASRLDLEQLFGDRDRMRAVVTASQGTLAPTLPDQVADLTRTQFLDSTEKEYAHVNADALTTVDGKRIDEGTPFEDADSADLEDCAVMFELERLRAEASGQQPVELGAYDCIVVDEAQEFAQLELRLMRRCLKARGTFIVAGDAAQQVDPSSFFRGWPAVIEALGKPDAFRAVLTVNYRCPEDVTALGRSILDENHPRSATEPAISRILHPTSFHLTAWLTETLRLLEAADPTASIALITRSSEAARALHHVLRFGTVARLALQGHFEFRPGITITCVPEVKGLEFDHVIVPDASASTYPSTADSRRSLYVAVTRATDHLALTAADAWSPLLS